MNRKPDNHLNVTKVAIKCRSEFLKRNLTFVDTPGVGSLHEKNSEEAYARKGKRRRDLHPFCGQSHKPDRD